MNKALFTGRITHDLTLSHTNNGKVYCNFSIAVNRDRVVDGQPDADFFNCTVWGKQAENLCNYQQKGNKILVEGRVQNSTYEDQQGQKRYATNIIADHIEYLEKKNLNTNPSDTGMPSEMPTYYQTKAQRQANAYANANKSYQQPDYSQSAYPPEFQEDALDIASDDLPF